VSSDAFLFVLVAGAGIIAFWVLVRHEGFGPRTLFWAIVHTVVACLALRLVPYALNTVASTGLPATRYVQVFGVALPLLVYGFLSGGWVTRIALGLLRP
jgi:hypothetical protein